MKVIPVINCPDFACAKEKIAVAKTFLRPGDFLHLDVTDGVFTGHPTWNAPMEWSGLKTSFNLEVHLMVEDPIEYLEPWIAAGAKRFIIHCETMDLHRANELLRLASEHNVEIMLSSNPSTQAETLKPYFNLFSLFQVLAVDPGASGQEFISSVLEKIDFLRHELPNATIEVDGGMNFETARMVKAVGADVIVSASCIFGNDNPGKAYEALKKI